MTALDPDTQSLLGGAVLALGFAPLCSRTLALPVGAGIAQSLLLALALAWRGWTSGSPGLAAGAVCLAAVGAFVLPRLSLRQAGAASLLVPAAAGPAPGSAAPAGTAPAGAAPVGRGAGGWTSAVLGLALVALSASVARDAALMQPPAIRSALTFALPAVLLGLLAATLRRSAPIRVSGLAGAMNGVLLAACGVPDPGIAQLVSLAVPALSALVMLTALLPDPLRDIDQQP